MLLLYCYYYICYYYIVIIVNFTQTVFDTLVTPDIYTLVNPDIDTLVTPDIDPGYRHPRIDIDLRMLPLADACISLVLATPEVSDAVLEGFSDVIVAGLVTS